MANVNFKGTPVSLSGSFPQVGQKAPEFTLVNSGLEDKHLSDFTGKKLLLIVPSLETSVCSTCTKTFHDKIMNRKDVSLLVISADLPFAQKRYLVEEKISNLTSLSTMRDQSFASSYGVLIQEGPLKGLCARAVLVLDENNMVTHAELVSEITDEPDYEKAINLL